MQPLRVYLDQTHWVALAREANGRSSIAEVADALMLVRRASRTGAAVFPLSAAHYFETYRRGNPASRRRLGQFMAEISRFATMAAAPDVLDIEVRRSLLSLAGRSDIPPEPRVFGIGFKHAFNITTPGYFENEATEAAAMRTFGPEKLLELIETAMLIGPDARLPFDGIAAPSQEHAQKQVDLELETRRKLVEWGHTPDRAHRTVLAQESVGVVDATNSAIADLGVDARAYINDGASLTAFVLSLPAKGTITRLRMTAHENTQFRWHIGDLNDMTALGMASAYCDVVVAEKQWGGILNRHADHLRAKVITKVTDLPPLLARS